MDEKDDTIDTLKSKIKDFKKRLEMSGVGANKDTSELELLRKNVSEMESIMKTKDFEIKKIKKKINPIGVVMVVYLIQKTLRK